MCAAKSVDGRQDIAGEAQIDRLGIDRRAAFFWFFGTSN